MLRSVRLRKSLGALLAVALLSVFSAGSAFAASDDDVLEELYQRVDGLESLVKDLSISVMNASKSLEAQAVGLQPRIFNVENMVKDLSFDVKKTVASLADIQGHVGALIAQVEEFQPLVIKLQSTVVGFTDRLDYMSTDIDKLTVGLIHVTEQSEATAGQIAALSGEFAQLYSVVSALKPGVEANGEAIGTLSVMVDSNAESIYENHKAIEELYGAAEETYIVLGTLDERTGKLERAVDELNILGPTLASLRNTVAGLAARADRVDARLGHLEDAIAHAGGGRDNSEMFEAAIADLQDQIDRIKVTIANSGGNAGSDDLRGKLGQLVIELEALKMEVATVREQVSTTTSVTTIDKEQIISEIRSDLSDLTGIQEQIDLALKTANSANGLALLALLAGVAAIALNLLL